MSSQYVNHMLDYYSSSLVSHQFICHNNSQWMLTVGWNRKCTPFRQCECWYQCESFSSCPGSTQGVFFVPIKHTNSLIVPRKHTNSIFVPRKPPNPFFVPRKHTISFLVPRTHTRRNTISIYIHKRCCYILQQLLNESSSNNDIFERSRMSLVVTSTFGTSPSELLKVCLIQLRVHWLRTKFFSKTITMSPSFGVLEMVVCHFVLLVSVTRYSARSITLHVVLILLINLSHTPPMWGASSGLNFLLISFRWRDFDIFKWSICSISFFSSLVAPTKLVPQSERIISGFPLRFMNLLRTLIKSSPSSEGETSIWTTLLQDM